MKRLVAALSKIKEAEDAAEAAVKKATEAAQEIMKTATATARERRKAIVEDTRQKRAEILQNARREAEAACVPLDEASSRDIERILRPDEAAFNKAIETLVDKLARG